MLQSPHSIRKELTVSGRNPHPKFDLDVKINDHTHTHTLSPHEGMKGLITYIMRLSGENRTGL